MRNRRDLLKGLGSATVFAGISTVGSAKPSDFQSFKQTMERAAEIRDKEGIKEYNKFLDSKNIKSVTTQGIYPFGNGETENKDGVSLQKIDDIQTDGIDIAMALSTPGINRPYSFVELYWRYLFKRGPEMSTGESPLDSIGISWKDECWQTISYDWDNTSRSSQHVDYEEDAIGSATFGFTVDDKEIASENTCPNPGHQCETYSDYYYGGVYIEAEKNPNCNGDDDTKLMGIYNHTWSGSYDSFGVTAGWPGSIGITYSTDSYVADKATTTMDDGSSGLVVTMENTHS